MGTIDVSKNVVISMDEICEWYVRNSIASVGYEVHDTASYFS